MTVFRGVVGTVRAFKRDRRGASAVEFAIVSMPFILTLLVIAQLGVYFLTQSSLDAAVVRTADSLVNTYYSGTAPAALTPSGLKTTIVANGSGLVRNDATLSVDFRLLATLGAGPTPIANLVDVSTLGSIAALRAQVAVVSVVPGLGTMYVRSSALVRRQNF